MTEAQRDPARPGAGRSGGTPPRGRVLARLLVMFLGLAILAGGAWTGAYFMLNKPRARRRKPASGAVLVEVAPVTKATRRVTIDVMGTVMPARRVSVAPRVGGQVVWVSPELIPGGTFATGDEIFSIDPEDYEIAVEKSALALARSKLQVTRSANDIVLRRSELAKAEETLRIERARSEVARSEYDLLGEEVDEKDRELVLRKPQLATAEAAVKAAKAAVSSARAALDSAKKDVQIAENALRDARLDLARTTVRAPFNGRVTDRSIERGSYVTPGQPALDFAGTDEYWIRGLVPVDQLRWIRFPSAERPGSTVRVFHRAMWEEAVSRTGRVLTLLSDLEPRGRMARILVSVTDPLGIVKKDAPRLVIGAYVELSIAGREISDVVPVPREHIHEGNVVWVAGADGRLDVRTVDIAWSGRDTVFVSARDLAPGEQLVVSDIASPVDERKIRIVGGGPGSRPASAPAETGSGGRHGPGRGAGE